jgi:hypothetical protein
MFQEDPRSGKQEASKQLSDEGPGFIGTPP